jgi:hypothetical protein
VAYAKIGALYHLWSDDDIDQAEALKHKAIDNYQLALQCKRKDVKLTKVQETLDIINKELQFLQDESVSTNSSKIESHEAIEELLSYTSDDDIVGTVGEVEYTDYSSS